MRFTQNNRHCLIKINEKYIGLQIKPAGGLSHIPQIFKEQEIQKTTHKKFTEQYGGKVFYVISIKEGKKKIIHNTEVIDEIKKEIERLKKDDRGLPVTLWQTKFASLAFGSVR